MVTALLQRDDPVRVRGHDPLAEDNWRGASHRQAMPGNDYQLAW
jgi:hypothetical protein